MEQATNHLASGAIHRALALYRRDEQVAQITCFSILIGL